MGFPVRHDPKNIDSLRRNKEVFLIFEEVRCIEYFQILNGFHEETTLQYQKPFIDWRIEDRRFRGGFGIGYKVTQNWKEMVFPKEVQFNCNRIFSCSRRECAIEVQRNNI